MRPPPHPCAFLVYIPHAFMLPRVRTATQNGNIDDARTNNDLFTVFGLHCANQYRLLAVFSSADFFTPKSLARAYV